MSFLDRIKGQRQDAGAPDSVPPPPDDDIVELGAYLYLSHGCVTCHGVEGTGGVTNPNSANNPVPAHDDTVQVPIRAGGRLTGRAGKYTLGLLDIQTGGNPEFTPRALQMPATGVPSSSSML